MKEIIQEGNKIFIVEDDLRKWKGGVIITCKTCGKQEVVNENSLCDTWKLCIKHTRTKLEAYIKSKRPKRAY